MTGGARLATPEPLGAALAAPNRGGATRRSVRPRRPRTAQNAALGASGRPWRCSRRCRMAKTPARTCQCMCLGRDHGADRQRRLPGVDA
jgi:hypothetical protein